MAPDRHWALDRTVNIGHILTTLAMMGLAFGWGLSVETRLAEQSIHVQNSAELARDVSAQLRELNSRVETLIEITAYQRGITDAQRDAHSLR